MITKKHQKYEQYHYDWYIVMHNVQRYYEDGWTDTGCNEESRQCMWRYGTLQDAKAEFAKQKERAYNDVSYNERTKSRMSSYHYVELSGFDNGKIDSIHELETWRYEYEPDKQ